MVRFKKDNAEKRELLSSMNQVNEHESIHNENGESPNNFQEPKSNKTYSFSSINAHIE
jgi:hypothetical protein